MSLLPSARLGRAGFVTLDRPDQNAWLGGCGYVRNFGALHVLVVLPRSQSTAHAMLGMSGPGQAVAWRNWSVDVGTAAHAVVDAVLEFAAVLDRGWPHGVGGSWSNRRPPRR